VLVLVVVVLVLSGVLSSHGASTSAASSFTDSRNPAQAAASAAAGGPWSLLLVVGVATQGAYSGSVSNITEIAGSVSGSPCSYSPSPGAPSTISSDGVGNVSQGIASAWVYLYSNSSGSVLLVSVTNGVAAVVGTLAGSSCNLAESGFSPIASAGIIDSTTASMDAGAAGGYEFLSVHPSANATLVLIGGYTIHDTTIGATWAVEYLSCALSGAGPVSAPAFVAVLSATTGTIIEARASTVTCPTTSSSSS
jgi:hypothetical protein